MGDGDAKLVAAAGGVDAVTGAGAVGCEPMELPNA